MSPPYFGNIMNVFLMHMLAIAGIEILVGLTMIGTLLAIVGLFFGVMRGKKATEPDGAEQDIEVFESEIAPATEKSHETKASPEESGKNPKEPVMAILQKGESRNEPVGGEELERQIVEKRLQRIADKRAEHKQDEPEQDKPDELPAFPTPPKVDDEKSAVPPIPKPFLHKLPQPGGEKPALPPLPKQGGNLPPMPGSKSEQEEPNLQTRDKKRDS